MNREELRNQAAGRRNSAEAAQKRLTWRCTFCEHEFSSETIFMKHRCKEKIKHEQLRSPLGQAAYSYYSHWMKCQKHSVPALENFSRSKFYSTFIKFAEHANRVKIPNVKRFIEVMIENGKVPPALWCRDAVYAVYLKTYDLSVPPTQQFLDGLALLEDRAREKQVPLSEIFKALGLDELELLIERRKLTFWLLLASPRFRDYALSLPHEERERLSHALGTAAAVQRTKDEPELFKEFGRAAMEVGL